MRTPSARYAGDDSRWCRCRQLPCEYVSVPIVADDGSAGGVAGTLPACPLRVEPGRRTTAVLAARAPSPRVQRAVGAADPRSAPNILWLAAGSQKVQQQALRDFAQAMRQFFNGSHGRPSWRKAGVHEGFRQVGLEPRQVEKLNRRYGQVWVSKVGWVRFRCSRPVPTGCEVLSHHARSGRALACRLRAHPRPDPRALRWQRCWCRSRCGGVGSAVHRGTAACA